MAALRGQAHSNRPSPGFLLFRRAEHQLGDDRALSTAVVRGSWFVVRGSWFVVRGSWFVVRGSWFVVRGSWFVVRGSWFVIRGS